MRPSWTIGAFLPMTSAVVGAPRLIALEAEEPDAFFVEAV